MNLKTKHTIAVIITAYALVCAAHASGIYLPLSPNPDPAPTYMAADFDNQAWIVDEITRQIGHGEPWTQDNLNQITVINLTAKDFSGQHIPTNISLLSSLASLTARSCKLDGTIPNFSLPKLAALNISENNLSGEIPNFDLPSLVSLVLSTNNLSGEIPDFRLPTLEALTLYTNNLSGTVPDFQLPSLKSLTLHRNKLTTLPASFTGINNVTLIHLYLNSFEQRLPDFNNCKKLQDLRLHMNKFYGEFPNLALPELTALLLKENHFSGSIPELLGCPKLSTVTMNHNAFAGSLSSRFQGKAGFYVDHNYLDDTTARNPVSTGGATRTAQFDIGKQISKQLVVNEDIISADLLQSSAEEPYSALSKDNVRIETDTNPNKYFDYSLFDAPVSGDPSIIYYDSSTGKLKILKVGTTTLVYAMKGASENNDNAKIKFTITTVTRPTIQAADRTIVVGSAVNLMDGVTATDETDGDLTANITADFSDLDVRVPGKYAVVYYVKNSSDITAQKTINITVRDLSTPVITATNTTVTVSSAFNIMQGVTAVDSIDGDITHLISVAAWPLNINKIGTYKIIYTVKNSDNITAKITRTITVVHTLPSPTPSPTPSPSVTTTASPTTSPTTTESPTTSPAPSSRPQIIVFDKVITVGKTVNLLTDLYAIGSDGADITGSIRIIQNNINNEVAGEYSVTYSVTDANNITEERQIKVIVSPLSVPRIFAPNRTVTLGETFNPLDGVTATDDKDGDITAQVSADESQLNRNTAGKYHIIYSVTNSDNATAMKTASITVFDPNAQTSPSPTPTDGTASPTDIPDENTIIDIIASQNPNFQPETSSPPAEIIQISEDEVVVLEKGADLPAEETQGLSNFMKNLLFLTLALLIMLATAIIIYFKRKKSAENSNTKRE